MQFRNAQFITSGTHANIYKVEVPNQETGETAVLCLKLFKPDSMVPHDLEIKAYEWLAHNGVYHWIPEVFGTAVRTPAQWGLDNVDGDEESEYHGILMEWIEGGEWLAEDNLSVDHVVSFIRGLVRIHDAGVVHCDAENQNMLVVPGSNRAVWIDFSCAQVDATDDEKANEMKYAARHPVLMV
jgi:serine/threonine protein kinase